MSVLGSLVVKLALDHAEYTQGLDRSSQEALKFAQNSQKTFDQAGRSAKEFFGNVAAGAVGVVASVVGIDAAINRTRQAIDVLASLDDAAQKTGSSVEDLSRIQRTARNFGDDFGTIEQSISKLAKGLATFDGEGNQALRALDAINVAARDSNGELRTSAEVYIDVARSLQDYKDGAEKTAVVNALFGKSGAELLPILNNIAQGIGDVTGVSAESARQADEFNNALARSGAIVNSLFGSLARDLLPTLINITNAVNDSAGSMNNLGSVSSVVGNILKSLVIAGRATVDVFVDVGREIGGRTAQLVALANLDLEGASLIGRELTKDFVNSRVEFDKFVDTVLNGDKKLSAAATSGGMKKTIDFALNLPAAQSESAKATQQAATASESFLEKLQIEADQLGKTSIEIRKMEAAKLGLSSVADPLIDQIEQETVAAKQLEAQLKKVESITHANMTADERFSKTISELNGLMAMPDGGLSVETYNRAVQKAQDELQTSMDSTKVAGRQAADEWNDIWRTSENTARMAFTAFAAHGTSAMESIGQSVKTAIIDVLYQLTVRKWMINIGASLGLAGGAGAANAAASGGNLLNLAGGASLIKSGFGLPGMIGRGASMLGGAIGSSSLGAFGSGMMGIGATGASTAAFSTIGGAGTAFIGGAGTALGGTGMGATAGLGSSFGAFAGPLAGIGAGVFGGSMIAGDKKLGPLSGTSSAAIGTAIGFAAGGPIGAVVGGLIGGLTNALFGHGPFKFRQQVAIGEATGAGFEGRVTDVFRAKGGLLVGNKHREQTAQNEADLLDLFSTTIKGYADASRGFAKNLGLDADLINGFSKTIRLESEKGKALTEEAIREMLSGISNEMAEGILPIIKTLKKVGEDSFAALSRLNTEYVTLVDASALVLGKAVSDARAMISGASFEGRTGFVDAAGGVDALTQQVQFFSANFLSAAELLAPAQEKLNESLGKLGLSTDLTRDQFKGLVQSFGEVGGISEETLQSLLKLAPAFVEVRNAQDLLAASSLELAQESRRTALSDLLQTQQQRAGLESRLLQAEGNTVELRKRELEALDPLNRGLLLSIFNREDSNRVNNERVGLENQLLQLQGDTVELRKRELEALDPLNRGLKESIFALEDARTAATNAQADVDSAFGALQRAVEGQRKSLTDDYNASLKAINISIADVTGQVGKLKGLSDLLGSALDTLRSISFQEASKQIQSAIESARAGNFVNAEDIKSAVQGLTQVSEDRFGTRIDFLRAQAQSANQLGELNKLTGKELTLQERTLSALNDRAVRIEEEFNLANKRLDQVVIEAQTQIDVLRGIDSSVLSVADAVNALQINIQSAARASNVVAGLSAGGGGGGGGSISISSLDNPSAPINSPSSVIGATQQQPGASRVSDVDIRTFFATSRTPEEIALAAIENNVSSARIAGIMNFSREQVDTFFRDNPNIPKFASGTSFVPRTGPAIVHQGERIINPEQNKDLIKLLEQLVQKIADGNADTSELLRVLKSMRVETDDGVAIRNKVAA